MQTSTRQQASLRLQIMDCTGVDTSRCYQCGKCSAGCPMALETRYRPHDVMRMVSRDRGGELADDPSIWLCLGCEACTARCPNGLEPSKVIDALRELAARESPGAGPRAVTAFHNAFLDQVRAHGRAFELGMVMEYKLRTGALTQDALAAPSMLMRGKLRLAPRRIEGVDEVRRIFEACNDAGGGEA
jgi:heterodisulfide reductase subunit C